MTSELSLRSLKQEPYYINENWIDGITENRMTFKHKWLGGPFAVHIGKVYHLGTKSVIVLYYIYGSVLPLNS